MKILLAADGSTFTKKALAFLVTNDGMVNSQDELVILHVQPPVPPRVKTMLGSAAVRDYHQDEARKVLEPIERFLERHEVRFTTRWVVGQPVDEILSTAQRAKVRMIAMGTHGHGLLGRVLMGSVAQRVLAGSPVPVLMVK